MVMASLTANRQPIIKDYTNMPAKKNRTIRILDEERESLMKGISNDVSGGIVDTLVNADMMQTLDKLPDESMNLIIVDPPYNLTKDFGNNDFRAMKDDDYEAWLRLWLPKVCDKLTKDGSLYICGDWHCTASLQRVLSENLTIVNRITWQREKGRGAGHNWKNGMEDIWFAVKDINNYHFNLDDVKIKRRVLAPYKKNGEPKDWKQTKDGNFRLTCPSNFWDDISVPFWSMPENTIHPTQKPEKLYAKLILASSRVGDIVFDPFMGSGTACVVAKKLNRHYIGIEINQEYCMLASKRINIADKNKRIQGYEDGVFWERNATPFRRVKNE